MTERCNAKDKEEEERIKVITDELAKTKGFTKLLPYNRPRILIFTGAFCSILDGTLMPLTGLVLSKLLTYMTADWSQLAFMA